MQNKNLCPICGDGQLTHKMKKVEREFNGKVGLVDLCYSECDACECEMALDSDLKKNSRTMNEFKKQCLGLLTGNEIASIRGRLNINQKEASKIFGGGENSFHKYERGDVIQSASMNKLIKISVKFPEVFDFLCEDEDISIKNNYEAEIDKVMQKHFEIRKEIINSGAVLYYRHNQSLPLSDNVFKKHKAMSLFWGFFNRKSKKKNPIESISSTTESFSW
ncbi:hypothetical protein GKR56_16970 [Providencia alcalifaciens]|uniref:type II toxin-antitoxin system MqsA family antitoxin n=1 Tax=Providencia alcalifaciens TaxID=126385 RepID=UPI0012B65E78|nr:type II toxin-antitoxin system MqsA family antitoxin [Providencia alcalifaciens]MTC54915.1 hypothetical protein [Providencia alcalifaciens]